MKPEEVLNAIYSLDHVEVWRASWEIICTKNSDLNEFYIPHLNRIRAAALKLPSPDRPGLRGSWDTIRVAVKILEAVSNGMCKCSVYLKTDQILPEGQEEAGLIEIIEKKYDPEWGDVRFECGCSECGQKYICREIHSGHYPWSKWTVKPLDR